MPRVRARVCTVLILGVNCKSMRNARVLLHARRNERCTRGGAARTRTQNTLLSHTRNTALSPYMYKGLNSFHSSANESAPLRSGFPLESSSHALKCTRTPPVHGIVCRVCLLGVVMWRCCVYRCGRMRERALKARALVPGVHVSSQ